MGNIHINRVESVSWFWKFKFWLALVSSSNSFKPLNGTKQKSLQYASHLIVGLIGNRELFGLWCKKVNVTNKDQYHIFQKEYTIRLRSIYGNIWSDIRCLRGISTPCWPITPAKTLYLHENDYSICKMLTLNKIVETSLMSTYLSEAYHNTVKILSVLSEPPLYLA